MSQLIFKILVCHIIGYTGIALSIRSSNKRKAVNALQHMPHTTMPKTNSLIYIKPLLTPFHGSLVWIRCHAFILILQCIPGGRYHQKKDISIILDIVTQRTV